MCYNVSTETETSSSAVLLCPKWRPETSEIPTNPGVYKFKDEFERVIYVGKAKSLRKRLVNYFQNTSALHPRTQKMVETARSVEWTIVANEIEALILEFQWIKKFEPRYNVIFRNDDKSYPYLAISNEKFNRVYITREKRNSNSKYYGPYPKTWAIRSTYEILQQVFQFRSCKWSIFKQASDDNRACLLGHIEKCLAPCIKNVPEYSEKIKQLKSFLKGNFEEVVDNLRNQMNTAADSLNFELAASLRDQITGIEIVLDNNTVELDRTTSLDVIAMHGDELEAGVHAFFIRHGKVVGEKAWIISRGASLADGEVMSSIIKELYLVPSAQIPPEILVSDLPDDVEILQKMLSGIRTTNVHLHAGIRGKKRNLVEKAQVNAKEALELAQKRRTTDLNSRSRALEEIQTALGLSTAPLRMECYDISHTQGEFQTGAMVVFEDALPKKNSYRLFNLRGAKGDGVNDDTAAVYEVIMRRLARLSSNHGEEDNKFSYKPGLIIIDGGKPQVQAAKRAMDDASAQYGVDKIPICSIAKRLEEIWLPDAEYPIILARNSLGLYLFQQLRDEAHRFSIVSMRKRRAKKYTRSILDDIHGLGPKRQKMLLNKYKSLKKLASASDKELLSMNGITPEIVQELRAVLAYKTTE
ncbi:MAG: excinuclease ABC subunit UvrC [Candidatus Ancillula sp.]|jgi:excinuclease ABC subunit C|nr:excinuclease ABC subunit UvrC [Candidatus Ancillula sp.]